MHSELSAIRKLAINAKSSGDPGGSECDTRNLASHQSPDWPKTRKICPQSSVSRTGREPSNRLPHSQGSLSHGHALNTEEGNMTNYREFEFRTQPWFDQSWFGRSNFQGFSQFIPMKTIVIHCFDPRASEIPQAVADYLISEMKFIQARTFSTQPGTGSATLGRCLPSPTRVAAPYRPCNRLRRWTISLKFKT